MKLTFRNLMQNSYFFLNSIKSNPKYGLFYCDNSSIDGLENFGDMLSHYITEQITNTKIAKTNSNNPNKLVAVGSLINNYTVQSGGVFWGTGIGDNISDITSARHKHHVSFRAVRGPITRNQLLCAGYKCPQIYGDPALLLPRFYQTKSLKKYRLGCIPHIQHWDDISCGDGVKKINFLRKKNEIEITQVIDEINECEFILSSSLHGIIVANAYGIPAQYMRVVDSPLYKEGQKFSDYFQSVSMPDQKPLVVAPGTVITEEYYKTIPQTVDIKLNVDLLLEVFPHDLNFS